MDEIRANLNDKQKELLRRFWEKKFGPEYMQYLRGQKNDYFMSIEEEQDKFDLIDMEEEDTDGNK